MSLLAALVLTASSLAKADLYDPDNYDGLYDAYALSDDFDSYGAYTDEKAIDPWEYGLNDEYSDFDWRSTYDESTNQYYANEYEAYYNQYGTYATEYGDDEYTLGDQEGLRGDCVKNADGSANITSAVPACDLKISGVDAMADGLQGGIDGRYRVSGCWNDRPKYNRVTDNITRAEIEARTLWFSSVFKDWDISVGSDVNETVMVVYGGDEIQYTRPNYLPGNRWRLAAKYQSSYEGNAFTEYTPVEMKVECASGEQLPEPKAPGAPTQTLMTNEEEDMKYREVYTQHTAQPKPTINLVLVATVLLAGMGVVLGLPHLMYSKSGATKSWAQQLEESRKARGGHTM